MYDLFDTFFNPWYDDSEYNKKAPKQQAPQNTQNLMKTDIRELADGYELQMELPGYKKEEVQAAFPGVEIYAAPLSLSIACHIGPGALALRRRCRSRSATQGSAIALSIFPRFRLRSRRGICPGKVRVRQRILKWINNRLRAAVFAAPSFSEVFMTLLDTLHITYDVVTPEHVEMSMPISEEIYQPHGFLHGGATLALLESCASRGAEARTDFDKELPFGLESDIRHKKPGKSGVLHGFADLEHEDPSYGGRKQFWHVVAKDDAGDVVSEGTFITKIVTKEHFAEKNRQREQR